MFLLLFLVLYCCYICRGNYVVWLVFDSFVMFWWWFDLDVKYLYVSWDWWIVCISWVGLCDVVFLCLYLVVYRGLFWWGKVMWFFWFVVGLVRVLFWLFNDFFGVVIFWKFCLFGKVCCYCWVCCSYKCGGMLFWLLWVCWEFCMVVLCGKCFCWCGGLNIGYWWRIG